METINVTRSYLPSMEEYVNEIADLWDSHWLTNMGCKHNQLQEKLKDYLLVPHCSLFGNGHMALEMALQALELPRGGEVITSPFTFASTTHAIVRNDLVPVFCDTDDKGAIDATKIEALITPKTVAIVPIHVYGNICDVYTIDALAQSYGLKVIYDAAHAFGETLDGKGIGEFGDMSMFSFHATKVFHTIEGGAITCKDEQYIARLYSIKNFGIKDAEHVIAVGANSKMNEFQAAMGLCHLRAMDQCFQKRRAVINRYCQHLEGIPGVRICLDKRDNIQSNYAYFPVCFIKELYGRSRDEVTALLAQHNIYARKYFYPLVNDFDCYKNQFDHNLTPMAKELSATVLTLPLYPDLQLKTVDFICSVLTDRTS